MTNMTLAIPNELSEKMKHHGEIRWTEVARQAIERKINDLDFMEKLAKKSKLTKKDVDEISEHIKESAAKELHL